MRRLLLLTPLLLLAGPAVAQPDRDNLYSTPRLPSADVLERLNLKMAWKVRIPVQGRRDGFINVTVAPLRQGGKTSYHLLAQTRNGLVVELDGETGEVLWKTRIGNAGTAFQPLGFNNNEVIAIRGVDVFSLSRKDGEIRWRFQPRGAAIGTPLLDAAQLFLNFGASVDSYTLPTRAERGPVSNSSFRSNIPLQLTPVQLEDYVVYPSPRGSVVVLNKRNMGEFVRFRTEGDLSAGPGVYEIEGGLYIGSRDTNLYGFYLRENEPAWRLATGGAVDRTPFVNDEDIYVSADRVGLLRVNRRTLRGAAMQAVLERRGLLTGPQLEEIDKELGPRRRTDASAILSLALQKGYITDKQKDNIRFRGGERVWTVAEGDRMLAVNPKFVYAFDNVGRLLVISRENPTDRGRVLSRYDMRDYPVPIINELTDRIYLAAHDGLIICLHDRDYATPREMKALLKPEAAPPMPVPMPMPGGGG